MTDGTEYYAAKAVHAIDPMIVKRARDRAEWWRKMHGPNDLDEEIYDELADALVALNAERQLFLTALRWIEKHYPNQNINHEAFRIRAMQRVGDALEHLEHLSLMAKATHRGRWEVSKDNGATWTDIGEAHCKQIEHENGTTQLWGTPEGALFVSDPDAIYRITNIEAVSLEALSND